MDIEINYDEVRLLIKALPFKTIGSILDTKELTPRIRRMLLSEYDLRDTLNNPNPRY
jgi:hypothetical protein|tara:strand:+ start:539 stop:709 length:171 start_codon:yes stop_codon:yes gene_type:complete